MLCLILWQEHCQIIQNTGVLALVIKYIWNIELFGFILMSVVLLYSFSVRNENSKLIEKCSCVGVDKTSISGKNKNEKWNEYICGQGDDDKYDARNDLQNKYDKIYRGTDFKVNVYFVADYFCK